ncbi:MAG TPA: hypothetical protein EYP08_04755 [Pyrodictiaceae archaeon]|nr:hypothetical protein [Pyrodictiaceae archaeon]
MKNLKAVLGIVALTIIITSLIPLIYIAQAGIHKTYIVLIYTPAYSNSFYKRFTCADSVYVWLDYWYPWDYKPDKDFKWKWHYVLRKYYWIKVYNYGGKC